MRSSPINNPGDRGQVHSEIDLLPLFTREMIFDFYG